LNRTVVVVDPLPSVETRKRAMRSMAPEDMRALAQTMSEGDRFLAGDENTAMLILMNTPPTE
jgi:hypothetical protein